MEAAQSRNKRRGIIEARSLLCAWRAPIRDSLFVIGPFLTQNGNRKGAKARRRKGCAKVQQIASRILLSHFGSFATLRLCGYLRP